MNRHAAKTWQNMRKSQSLHDFAQWFFVLIFNGMSVKWKQGNQLIGGKVACLYEYEMKTSVLPNSIIRKLWIQILHVFSSQWDFYWSGNVNRIYILVAKWATVLRMILLNFDAKTVLTDVQICLSNFWYTFHLTVNTLSSIPYTIMTFLEPEILCSAKSTGLQVWCGLCSQNWRMYSLQFTMKDLVSASLWHVRLCVCVVMQLQRSGDSDPDSSPYRARKTPIMVCFLNPHTHGDFTLGLSIQHLLFLTDSYFTHK